MRRNIALDYIKGLCIIIVVFFHTVNFSNLTDAARNLLQSILLNAFFVVSGWLIYAKKYQEVVHKDNILHKFRKLIVPYLGFGFAAIIYDAILVLFFDCRVISDTYFGIDLIKRDVFCLISGLGIGTLWFLPILFLSFSVCLIIVHFVKGKYKTVLFCIISVTIIILGDRILSTPVANTGFISKLISEYLMFFHRFLKGTGYTILGFVLAEAYYHLSITKNMLLSIASGIGAIVSYEIAAYNISVILLNICFVLTVNIIFCRQEKPTNALNPFIIWCGKKSLYIMVFHYLFVLPLVKMIFSVFIMDYTIRERYILFFVCLLLTCDVSHCYLKFKIKVSNRYALKK